MSKGKIRTVILAMLLAIAGVFMTVAPASALTYTWSGWVCRAYDTGGTVCFHWRIANTGTYRRVDEFGWGYNTDQPVTGFALQEFNSNTGAGIGYYTQNGSTQLFQYQTGVISTTSMGYLANNIPGQLQVNIWESANGNTKLIYDYVHTF